VSHEVGHNFGMQHDDKCTDWCALNPASCDGGVYNLGESGGKYVMWSRSVDGSEPNNKKFSQCSTDTAGQFINTKGSTCFNALGQEICGNGVVQGTELCDCGETDPVACALKDPCCTVNCTLSTDYDGLGTPALCRYAFTGPADECSLLVSVVISSCARVRACLGAYTLVFCA